MTPAFFAQKAVVAATTLLSLVFALSASSVSDTSGVPPPPAVTVPGDTAPPATDSTTRFADTADTSAAAPDGTQQLINDALKQRPPTQPDSISGDTTELVEGALFGAEFGWSLGSFALTDYWERALPDSLGSFSLSSSSFAVPPDTSATEAVAFSDTAALEFKVREAPTVYTMSFPVALSLVSLSPNRRLTLSLRGSWMRKVQTSAITLRKDTSGAVVDYRQSINIYSLFLSATYGRRIPAEYFSVEGIERCYFITGIDLSPLINARIASKSTSPPGNKRLAAVALQSHTPRRALYGAAAGVRFGISMLKRINRTSATDVTACYTMQGYGYFFDKGTRVTTNAIAPGIDKRDKPLFWISNRFEIAITLLGQQAR